MQKKINSKSLFKPSKKMNQLCNGTNGVIKWNPWPFLIFWWNIQIAWMCLRCLEKVLINSLQFMVVSCWWILWCNQCKKNEKKKTIQDCLVGGVNPFEENLSTWIVSLDNSENQKKQKTYIWNHHLQNGPLLIVVNQMELWDPYTWPKINGKVGPLKEKWKKQHHQSIQDCHIP